MKFYPSYVNELIQSGTRTFKAVLLDSNGNALQRTIFINGEAVTEDAQILEFKKICASNADSNDFSVGSTVSQYIEVTMEKPNKYYPDLQNPIVDQDIEDTEVQLVLKLATPNAVNPYYDFNLGFFTVTKPKTDEETITFAAFDRMLKLETLFSSDLAESTKTTNVLNTITTLTGVTVDTNNSDNYSNLDIQKPTALSCREVLGYVAELFGGFAVVNNLGNIVIKRYSKYVEDNVVVGVTITPDIYWETFQHNDLVYELQSINCVIGNDEEGNPITYTAGTGTKHITFSNPFMTQTRLDTIWNSFLHNFSYMPGTVEILGDPRLDVWDIVTIEDLDGNSYDVPVMSMQHEFDGGLVTTITSVGKSESDNTINYTGPTTKTMDRYYAQLVTIDKALINYATIDQLFTRDLETGTLTAKWASIDQLYTRDLETDTLIAKWADVDQLFTRDIETGTLIAKWASVNQLETLSGNVTILNTDVGTIKSLLAGTAAAEEAQVIRLTADNAVIDGAAINVATMNAASVVNLISGTITVGDLSAGRISTDDFEISSDDGRFLINSATLVITDENEKPRIQLGKDNLGNFTFVILKPDGTGVLIDETGIQDTDAIANGIINDSKIANKSTGYNGISADKLNINSIITELNDENSSLTVKSSNVKFNDATQTLEQLYTTATTAKNNADSALRAIEGISSLDNLTAILSNDAHTIHTDSNGDNGNYTFANTTIYAYKGNMDITEDVIVIVNPSSSVTGTWNNTTKTYQITNLSEDNGYVDFDIAYGSNSGYLNMPGDDDHLIMPDDLTLKLPIPAHVYKRFSISKSKDGRTGSVYKLNANTNVVKLSGTNTFTPSIITLSAKYSDGTGTYSYADGYIRIDTSTNGSDWTYGQPTQSATASFEISPPTLRYIRCLLLDSNEVELDRQVIFVLVDAEELRTEIQTFNNTVTEINQGIAGIEGQITETQTDLQGVANSVLLYQTPYVINGDTVTFTAKVYKAGLLVTTDYPSSWFSWYRRTEQGEIKLGEGYTLTTQRSLMDFGGVVIGRFETFDDSTLVLPDNKYLIMPDDKRLTVYTATA